MKSLVILVMISYFIQLTVTNGSELSVLQYPQDINVSLDSTILILCEFDYPDKTPVDTEVYWRKGPTCNQPGLQPSTSTSRFQKSQVTIKTNGSKRYSILRLENIQLKDTDMYFCDVSLTEPPPVRRKCGSGSRLTVQESICSSNIGPDITWWVWFFLLGCSICVSNIIISFCLILFAVT
ncbi:paired immunoglobulin-like type 2 receptor alpha isoform X2 [Emydura macquarii macquarii]|uniref:paired immunoglobulin-like type 2 receptor alpha isoform X2 n=1 Tax=Emydura macquarii macquarii TaxID=1129001 RepID=UPI00352A3E17